MSWDLAISDNGDAVLTAHRDLAGKSGTDLIEQRMKLRLKLQRGTWVYDDNGTLGSNLGHLSGMAPAKAGSIAVAYVREALRGMDEITIEDIQVTTDAKSIGLLITYHVSDVVENVFGALDDSRQLEISLPLSGGGA